MRVTAAIPGVLPRAARRLRGERTPRPPVPLKSLALHDVQGLCRRSRPWVAEDRTAIVQVSDRRRPGSRRREKRYKSGSRPSSGPRSSGSRRHHLVTLRCRSGRASRMRPARSSGRTRAGATIRVRKWGQRQAPDFDPVYSFLLRLCRARGKSRSARGIRLEWRPDGFAVPWK